jgi:hypothetical protein
LTFLKKSFATDRLSSSPTKGPAEIAGRIAAARQRRRDPFAELPAEAVARLRLTARGYHRVLTVARTLADLEAAESVRRVHIAEILSYCRVAPGRGRGALGHSRALGSGVPALISRRTRACAQTLCTAKNSLEVPIIQ